MKRISKVLFLSAIVIMYLATFIIKCPLIIHASDDVVINTDNFPDDVFRAYVSGSIDTDGNGVLSPDECNNVTVMQISDRNISKLDGIEFFPNIDTLDIENNLIEEIDLSCNTKLTSLFCGNNKLKALDISKCQYLASLYCEHNEITSLSLTNNTELKYVSCNYNKLTTLDISKCTKLSSLSCSYNSLTSLDISNNVDLKKLSCGDNKIATLDISNNILLEYLFCNNNQLTSLDTGNNINLDSINCSDNQITNLDFSNNQPFALLSLFNNKYVVYKGADNSIDLSKLPGKFDITKASNWSGADFTIDGYILTMNTAASSVDEITYEYYCGNGVGTTFTLVVSPHIHAYEEYAIKATKSKDGRIDTKCSICGKLSAITVIPSASVVKLNKTSYVYNGKQHLPVLSVIDRKGNVIDSENYTFTYPNSIRNVGKYKVKLVFKNKYSGTFNWTITISPKSTSITKLKAVKRGFFVKWSKRTSQNTGYQIQYSTNKRFKRAKTINIKRNKTVSKSITKLKPKVRYYVRIRTYKTVKINGKNVKMYSKWSKTKYIKTKQ